MENRSSFLYNGESVEFLGIEGIAMMIFQKPTSARVFGFRERHGAKKYPHIHTQTLNPKVSTHTHLNHKSQSIHTYTTSRYISNLECSPLDDDESIILPQAIAAPEVTRSVLRWTPWHLVDRK